MGLPVRQSSFVAGEVAPALRVRADIERYTSSLAECTNFIVMRQGGVTNRPGTEFCAEAADSTVAIRLIPFVFSEDDTYVLEFGDQTMRVYRDGALVETVPGTPFELLTPYAAEDLPRLRYAQLGDVMTIVHPMYEVHELKRWDHDDWTIDVMSSEPVIAAPTGLKWMWIGGIVQTGGAADDTHPRKDWRWVVTAEDENGNESLPSDPFYNGDEYLEGSALVVVYPDRTSPKFEWNEVEGAVRYNVYRGMNGIYGYIGSSDSPKYSDDATAPSYADTPPAQTEPFTVFGSFPSHVCYYEQRRVFARTDDNPQRIVTSNTGDFSRFDERYPTQADDSIAIDIASATFDEIRALIPLRSLLVLTGSNIWSVSGAGGDPMTPTSIEARPHDRTPASWVQPVVTGTTVIFVSDSGAEVIGMSWSYESDSYVTEDLSVMAQHLFRGHEITSLAYSRAPHSVVWAVRDDGVLLGLTFDRAQQVWAWHRHTTDGYFEDVCSIPEGDQDAVYVVVRRTIGGTDVRYVERFFRRDVETADDARLLDCAVVYEGVAATTFSGLSHLNGERVTVLGDGIVFTSVLVSAGSITLPVACSNVVTGLPYASQIQTVPLRLPQMDGRPRIVSSVILEVESSRGAKAGEVGTALEAWKVQAVSDDYSSTVPPLETGEIEIPLRSRWGEGGQVIVRQEQPLPCTILSLTPEVQVGGR